LERVTANAAGSHTDSFSNNYKIEVVADASFDRVQTPQLGISRRCRYKYGDVVTTGTAIDHMKSLGA
jgi:hypothetical protein